MVKKGFYIMSCNKDQPLIVFLDNGKVIHYVLKGKSYDCYSEKLVKKLIKIIGKLKKVQPKCSIVQKNLSICPCDDAIKTISLDVKLPSSKKRHACFLPSCDKKCKSSKKNNSKSKYQKY